MKTSDTGHIMITVAERRSINGKQKVIKSKGMTVYQTTIDEVFNLIKKTIEKEARKG